MSKSKGETRGRPGKNSGNEDIFAKAVHADEMNKCYSGSYRMEVSCLEMRNFLHGSGVKKPGLEVACFDLEVFMPFVASRLYEKDVGALIGHWLEDEKWDRVANWKTLCERWNSRWLKPRKEAGAGNITAVWRLGCMVEGWRLLDEFYLERPEGYLYPPSGVICAAGLDWIEKRGVSQRPTESILRKYVDLFEQISLGWIPRNPLMRGKELTPLFPEGEEPPSVSLNITQAGLDDLAQEIRDYERKNGDSADRELEYLRKLDWP